MKSENGRKAAVVLLCASFLLGQAEPAFASSRQVLEYRQTLAWEEGTKTPSGSEGDDPAKPAEPSKPSEPSASKTTLSSRLTILNYNVQKDGKNITKIEKGETFNLLVNVKDTGILTSDVIPETLIQEFESQKDKLVQIPDTIIDVDKLNDSFSEEKAPQVFLKSKGNEALRLLIVFPDLTWDGDGKTLQFDYGYPQARQGSLSIKPDYSSHSLDIRQCQETVQEPEPEPEPEPSNPGIDYGGGDYGGGGIDYTGGSYSPGVTAEPVKISAATPYIIVSDYSYGGESVQAGKTFELSLTFKNTSKKLPVENIMVSLDTEEGLTITSSSNTFYIESIGAGKTVSKKIKMKALGSDKSSSPAIMLTFRYEYVDLDTRNSQTSSERISIPVVEPDRFEVTEPVLPETVYAGEETLLSFTYVNKGKGTLSNVAAEVDGDISTLTKIQNLGNFESGKSGTIDVILTPETPGEEEFKIKLTYENASGEPVTLTYPFKLTVLEPEPAWNEEIYNPAPEEPEEQSDQAWLWWTIGIAAAAGLGFWLWRRKKKKNKEEANPDDGWDEFSGE